MDIQDHETEQTPHGSAPLHVPEDFGQDPSEGGDTREASLTEDISAMFEDGKTYVDAEIQYQKSRAAYSANRLKYAALYAAGAFGVFHLALIGLTVGLVIALTPLVGAWIATAIVVGVLLATLAVLLSKLRSKIDDLRWAFGEEKK